MEGSGSEQWGENWVEDFGSGAGNKKGETWSVDGGGHRYQRWWGEEHFGNGWVRRFGNSTTGAASHILLLVFMMLHIPRDWTIRNTSALWLNHNHNLNFGRGCSSDNLKTIIHKFLYHLVMYCICRVCLDVSANDVRALRALHAATQKATLCALIQSISEVMRLFQRQFAAALRRGALGSERADGHVLQPCSTFYVPDGIGPLPYAAGCASAAPRGPGRL